MSQSAIHLQQKLSHSSKYRILGLVGQGQFGRVFCAVNRQSGNLVALKEIDYQRFPTHKFLRELRFLITLRHPNIVTFQALENNQTGRYLVMDYCEGGTLRHLMESGSQLSLPQSLKLIADILAGLECSHSRGIIHCDLKPENILLKLKPKGWVAQIADFGVARMSQESKNAKVGDTGSPAYMAPERFYSQYSSASDLYSVGVLLFELLVGQRPFSGMPRELMNAHLNQQVEVPDTVPSLLRSTITKALQKLPNHRFKSAGEMLKSIQLAAEVGKVIEQPTSPFFVSVNNRSLAQFKSIRQESLSAPVTFLAADSQQVYQGRGSQVLCQTYTDSILTGERSLQWQVNFNHPVKKLILRSRNCFVLTESSSDSLTNYSIYCLSKNQDINELDNQPPSALLSVQSPKIETAIDPQEGWIAIAKISTQFEQKTYPSNLQLFNLPNYQPISSPLDCPFPDHLIALDSNQGLAIFTKKKNQKSSTKKTVIQLFSSQGSFSNAFSLPIVLDKVVSSISDKYSLLAIEENNSPSALLIELEPFRVTRIALDITPAFILATDLGYILANLQGEVILLDYEGQVVGRFETPAPPTAIATFAESGLLLATWSNKQGSLYTINLQQLFPQLSYIGTF